MPLNHFTGLRGLVGRLVNSTDPMGVTQRGIIPAVVLAGDTDNPAVMGTAANPMVTLAGGSSAATFGPTPYTFTGPNQSLVFQCQGAASALIQLTDNFTGSISSFNSADPDTTIVAPSRLYQTSVGSLGRSIIQGQGAAHAANYRVVLGGFLYILRSSADFVGTATVAVFATATPAISFTHGAVHTANEEALRAGRAYTASSGIGTIAGGNHMVFYFSNPAGSGQRIFIPRRRFTAARQDNLTPVAPQFYGMTQPTANLPTGVAAISNRGDGLIASPAIARFAVTDTANLPSGGTVGPGNLAVEPDLPFERTLEPGKSFAQVMSNTTSAGLGGAIPLLMCITFEFYQEPI